MNIGTDRDEIIDPEVKAFVFSLVNALGGSSAGDDGRYVLGDDALAVLKDIKRWLRLYDDKTNRLDVARLLAEANLVKGDLLEILADWPEDATESSFRAKIALVCVDLLTQLTWPIEKDELQITMHHFLHMPYLRAAQASYKSAILGHDRSKLLRTIVRVGLPAIAQPRNERSPTEDNIIKVVLYLFRNLAMIAQPEGATIKEGENDISRSTTIDAFHEQDIFDLLLTICSCMVDEFPTHDVEVLDILFNVVKGVNADTLFLEHEEVSSSNTKELRDLISKEKGLLASHARHAPSRHNRFGTMLWIKREGERYSTVFGQGSLVNEQLSMVEIDKRKRWKKPRRANKNAPEGLQDEFDTTVALTAAARRHLCAFVDKFLDSSFNPLFTCVRRAIEQEASRVLQTHSHQYYYLVAWFLRAESARRKKHSKTSATNSIDVESFALVASVLNQETFVLLNRKLQSAHDRKDWKDLNAAMKCFTQILLTVQEMTESPLDEDQEIAENILNRIFYEQSTHDRIVSLLRSYKDQGFGYLDACTELSHVFLRLLEKYSKQNVDLQVRSRRRARKKVKDAQAHIDGGSAADEDREHEAEDVAEAQRTTTERKFDFSRFAAKFVNQASVDTFVALLKYYADLNEEQLKRTHRFFYRAAFKMDFSVLLFRIDIIALLHKMIKGPEGLGLENSMYREWEELTKQLFRRVIKKVQERPVLAVEMLFSKINSSLHYLEHGYDKEVQKKGPRAPAELEVKPGMDKAGEIGVAVSILIDKSKSDVLAWVKEILTSAATERKSWEEEAKARQQVQPVAEGVVESIENADMILATDGDENPSPSESKAPSILVRPDTDDRRTALDRDKHLRLLLTLLGFERLYTEDDESEAQTATWFLPSSISSSTISEHLDLINRVEFDPPIYENGKSAEAFVRSKAAAARSNAQRGQENGEDSEGDSGLEIEENGLFPPGGPTIRQSSRSPGPDKRRRHRNRHAADEFLDEHELEERREARRKAEAAKRKKIKSSLFVHESDDESDDERDKEFFAREERRRIEYGKGVAAAARRAQEEQLATENKKQKRSSRKRKSSDEEDEVRSGAEAAMSNSPGQHKKRKTRARESLSALLGDDDSEGDSSMVSTPPVTAALFGEEDSSEEAAHEEAGSASRGDGPGARSTTNDSDAETETDTTPPSSQQLASIRGKNKMPSSKQGSFRAADDQEIGGSSDEENSDSDKENAQVDLPVKSSAPHARRAVRAGFVIESDSDE